MTCKWCARMIPNLLLRREGDRTRQYPPRQSLFQRDQGTIKALLPILILERKHIPYVPAINQLTEEFSIDSSPPTSTDATINPEDMLYVFETTTDDNKLLQFVSPLAFTRSRMISYPDQRWLKWVRNLFKVLLKTLTIVMNGSRKERPIFRLLRNILCYIREY